MLSKEYAATRKTLSFCIREKRTRGIIASELNYRNSQQKVPSYKNDSDDASIDHSKLSVYCICVCFVIHNKKVSDASVLQTIGKYSKLDGFTKREIVQPNLLATDHPQRTRKILVKRVKKRKQDK